MNSSGASRARIRQVTERIINLPTLPTIISKMIELVDNPKTSTASLARLIATDQALTARILKLANSAYYGFSREISTVNMAIVVLGFNTVKDTGLSLSVFDIFKDAKESDRFNINEFWEHSVGCGIAARTICQRCLPSRAGEAFVAGLLHDLGKVILRQYFPHEFAAIMERTGSGTVSLDAAEEELLGVGHGQIGGWLVEKWRLPPRIVESLIYHHTPMEARQEAPFSAVIGLADYCVHRSGIGGSGRVGEIEPPPGVWEILGNCPQPITPDSLDEIQSLFLLEFDKAETFISFIHEEG